MEPPEIIFVGQLNQHRLVTGLIEDSRHSWERRSAWFPSVQLELYSHIYKLHAECLKKYGAEKFGYYAKRMRLHMEYMPKAKTSLQWKIQSQTDHFVGYKVPRTTNGIYGSLRPSKMFWSTTDKPIK